LRIIKIISYIACLTLFSFSTVLFGNTGSQANTNSLIDKLEVIFAKQKEDQAGVSVLVRKNDKVIVKLSKGLANSHKNIAINSNTGFRIGSISKPFTALAIMKLVEQNKISLSDSVAKFVTELPARWGSMTLEHLLSHRVYISHDFFSDSNLDIANLSTNQDLVKFLSSKKIKVEATASNKARYCNSCYVLLAEVVSKASGVGFSNYVHDNIFIPANMKDSYIVEKGVSLKSNDALNYAKTANFSGIMQYTTGAMAQVSSIDDLNHFIIALKENRIVSQETLRLMSKVHADLGDDGTFGLGWIIGWGDEPFFSHGGSQDGYQSELFFYPKYDLEIAILTNGGDDTYEVQRELMRSIITHFK
jgi:CubicO group peptidase (beta-lactamase class C family)